MLPHFPPGIKVCTLSVSTHTATQAADALGVKLGCIAKSLVFYSTSDRTPILIIVSGVNHVDKAKVGKYLKFKIKTAGPEFVLRATGYPVGGVPPFSHIRQIRTLMDEDLMAYSFVWAAAGTPDSLFKISPTRLAGLARAEIITLI